MKRTLRLGTGLLAGALVLGPAADSLAADPPAGTTKDVESTRNTLAQWVETQRILEKERKDWTQAREILIARIDVAKKEVEQLEQRLRQAREDHAGVVKEKDEVLAERTKLLDLSETMGAHAAELESGVSGLHSRLPEPAKEKLAPLYDRLPRSGDAARASVAERFQNILGILNEIGRFNSEITVASEIRALSDGKPSEVKTIYVGLGQAYYLSARGEAGVGEPGAEGWTWRPANAIARDVAQALEILQNKSGPKFVPLPVTIQ